MNIELNEYLRDRILNEFVFIDGWLKNTGRKFRYLEVIRINKAIIITWFDLSLN